MTVVVLRSEAEADLEAIALHTLESGGEERALALSLRLRQRTKILEAHPYAGRPRPELGEDVRSLVERPYVLLYRLSGETAEIIAVLHGARDLPVIAKARPGRTGED